MLSAQVPHGRYDEEDYITKLVFVKTVMGAKDFNVWRDTRGNFNGHNCCGTLVCVVTSTCVSCDTQRRLQHGARVGSEGSEEAN